MQTYIKKVQQIKTLEVLEIWQNKPTLVCKYARHTDTVQMYRNLPDRKKDPKESRMLAMFDHYKNKVWRAGIPDFTCPGGLVESFASPKAQPECLLRLH